MSFSFLKAIRCLKEHNKFLKLTKSFAYYYIATKIDINTHLFFLSCSYSNIMLCVFVFICVCVQCLRWQRQTRWSSVNVSITQQPWQNTTRRPAQAHSLPGYYSQVVNVLINTLKRCFGGGFNIGHARTIICTCFNLYTLFLIYSWIRNRLFIWAWYPDTLAHTSHHSL